MSAAQQNDDDLLLDYLDGTLSPSERQAVEIRLKSDKALDRRYHELAFIHQALKDEAPPEPSRQFTQQVMANLHHYPARNAFSIRNGLILLGGILLASLLAAVLVSSGVFDSATTTLDVNQFSLPKQYLPEALPSVSISGKHIVNIIILFNLGLAWIILDRVILKPYFQRRIQSQG
jgi:anti-sigma factor RsiW